MNLLTATLLLAACGGADAGHPDLAIQSEPAAGAPATLRVDWTPPEHTTSRVVFGPDSAYGSTGRTVAGSEGQALLMGIPAGTEAHFRVEVEEDGETWTSADHRYTSPEAPPEVPTFEVTLDDGADWGQFIILAIIRPGGDGSTESGIVAIDRLGRPVWWAAHGTDQVRSARVTADGQEVLLLREAGSSEFSPGVYALGFDAEIRRGWPSDAVHHDFVELDADTVAIIETEVQSVGDQPVAGDRVVEIGLDGSRRTAWSAWDTLEPTPKEGWYDEDNPDALEWTHANGLGRDASSGAYLISLYWAHQVAVADPDDGTLRALIGGIGSVPELAPDAVFGPQHAPVATEGGLLIFDNALDLGGPSRVLHIDLDEGERLWEFTPDVALDTTPVEGDVRVLDNGYIFTSFGLMGALAVLDQDGQPVWQAQTEDAVVIARGDVF